MVDRLGKVVIDTAVARYAEACDQADLSHRPVVWAAHFDVQDSLLGTLSVPQVEGDRHLGHVTHGTMSPFAVTTSVHTSFSITDSQAALGSPRSLFVTRLTAVAEGVNMNHWQVPYEMDDRGRIVTEDPIPATAAPAAVLAAISTIASQRLSGQAVHHFDEAFRASVRFLELLAQGRLYEGQ